MRHLLCKKADGKLLNPWGNSRKSWTHLPPSFLWLTPEFLDSPSVLILFSNTRKKQKNSSTSQIRLQRVTKWLIVWQVPIKNGCRDTPLTLRDFSQSNTYVLNFTLNWQFWFYGPNLPRKSTSGKKTEKVNNTIEFCIFELLWVPNFSLNWQFRFFGPNLPKKGIFVSKQKKWTTLLNCTYSNYSWYQISA